MSVPPSGLGEALVIWERFFVSPQWLAYVGAATPTLRQPRLLSGALPYPARRATHAPLFR